MKYKLNHRDVKFYRFFMQYTKNHSNKFIMAHININSLRNKFDILTNKVSEYIDILMISETKVDNTFLHALYHLKDFSNPYRLDRNSPGGGILVYVTDNIPCNLVKLEQKFENFEDFFIELELSNKKKCCLVIAIIHIKVIQNNTCLVPVRF